LYRLNHHHNHDYPTMLLATLTLLSVMIIPPTVIGTSKNSLYAFSAEKRVLPDFSFGAAADWACNFNTENTVSNIISKNPKLVLGIGDYYYSDYYNESLGDGATTDAAHAGLE
jgi:hypothetical protein